MRRPLTDLELPERRYAPRNRRSYTITPDGRIEVDSAKRLCYPFWLTTEPESVFVPAATSMGVDGNGIPILAGGITNLPAIMPIDEKGPFEAMFSSFTAIRALDGLQTDQFTIVVFDPEFRPLLMNREIHARTMAGGFGSAPIAGSVLPPAATAGGRPLVWPETFFMDPDDAGKAVFVGFRNLATDSAINVRFVLHGVRYYAMKPYEDAVREKERMFGMGRTSYPYFYTTDSDIGLAPTGTPGDNAEFHMRITDDADVEIFKMTHYADQGPNSFLWRIQEKAGKRFLDSAGPVTAAGGPNGLPGGFGFGDAEFPFIPFETLYWEQNFKAILSVANVAGPSLSNRVWLTFVSRKIVPVQSYRRKVVHVED